MLCLMQGNLLQFAGGESREQPIGNEDARLHESDHAGPLQVRSGANLYRSASAVGQRRKQHRAEARGQFDRPSALPQRA